jgi:hypothetical protein
MGRARSRTLSAVLSDACLKQERLRVGQGKKPTTQRSHQHPVEFRRGIKAEKGNGATNQPPTGAASTWERPGKAQRLRAGMEVQANLPKQSRRWIPVGGKGGVGSRGEK